MNTIIYKEIATSEKADKQIEHLRELGYTIIFSTYNDSTKELSVTYTVPY